MSNQPDLFETLAHNPLEQANAPDLDLKLTMIHLVKQAIRNSGMSRPQIVDRINLCLRVSDDQVTERQLNHWLSPSQANNVPAFVLPAICWATQSMEPVNGLIQELGYKTADRRDDLMSNIARSKIEAAQKSRESRELEKMALQMLQQSENNQ